MIKYIFLSGFIFLSMSLALANNNSQGDSFTFSRVGRDSDGSSLSTRFQIDAQGRATWNTASRGSICPSEGGVYQGNVEKEKFSNLVSLAVNEIEKQMEIKNKNSNQKNPTNRSTVTSLTAWKNGKDYYSTIQDWSEGVMGLDRTMAEIQGGLAPKSVVKMELKKKGNNILVVFKYTGNEDALLVLPEKDALEAFSTNTKTDLKYVKNPKKTSVVMNKRNNTFEIELKGNLKKDDQVFYTNKVLKHHRANNANFLDLNICNKLNM